MSLEIASSTSLYVIQRSVLYNWNSAVAYLSNCTPSVSMSLIDSLVKIVDV
jgi:hypothetical protein